MAEQTINFGKAVRLCRVQKNMSRKDLAKASAISVSYLSLVERNKRDPNISIVERIAKGLDIPLSVLMFLAQDPSQIHSISPQLAEKLAHTALMLIGETAKEH